MESVRARLQGLRITADQKIATNDAKFEPVFDSHSESLKLIRPTAEQTAQNQAELGKLKAQLRELEDELVKALAVKTRKEAKRMAIADSQSEARAKVEELHKIVQDQAARSNEYEAILSQQSKALQESKKKSEQTLKHREEIKDAISWYNRVLGFRIDGGHGVKFTFTNINRKCPTEEYSFVVRYSDNVYTLLDCNPRLNDAEELVRELNKSNSLFKFVGIMRDKFQAAASSGTVFQFKYQDQDTTSISVSAPASSVSTDFRSESPLPLRESNLNVNHQKGVDASSLRRSPRFRGK